MAEVGPTSASCGLSHAPAEGPAKCLSLIALKTLKQRYSQWYNRQASRRGTLWEERFKSVLVEGTSNALLTMAAYIDLNAVRAGMVEDPKEYRWSGYGEALGGGKPARNGIRRLLEAARGSAAGWNDARLTYRMMLYDRGESLGVDDKGRPIRSGIDSELVERVLREGPVESVAIVALPGAVFQ